MKKEVIICRCEEISEEEIVKVIKQGYTSLNEIKRLLRCGMGHCQGRSCLPVIARLICKYAHKSPSEIKFPTSRPPLKPIPLDVLAQYNKKS
ncbi:MAG: (2Fe-2S)-binding protein [candidate division WOR-3 bacterium]|nr:(2Fe-2S)-binding protein [candidate division WOR-3 bacterium]MCX7757850.1 (2Fe-2S)-binding protein [candidate division WOR-3 bacterium]MDW7988233.1 (2Fe-2S)-binding protein [candidate division WOR-3 bacterium]